MSFEFFGSGDRTVTNARVEQLSCVFCTVQTIAKAVKNQWQDWRLGRKTIILLRSKAAVVGWLDIDTGAPMALERQRKAGEPVEV
jgi:hypothetical protein